MIVFPHIKINIGLNVVEKREDGYHNIETVMYPVAGLADILEVVFPTSATEEERKNGYVWRTTGRQLNCPIEKNTCIKALRLLGEKKQLPLVGLHLHKVVPDGAGLGAGSADASFVIKELNKLLELGLTVDEMKEIAVRVGADCPFFIDDQPAYAEGVGEQLTGISLPHIANKKILIVKPDVSVSTAEAYAAITPRRPELNVSEVVKRDVVEWRKLLRNDFEEGVFEKHPELRELKERMYDMGALYAQMSGSGSAIYGIFDEKHEVPQNAFGELFTWRGRL
jgi:4-diphosphocytidyl-2-C-methyl-D-erythritol kinase